MDSRMDAPAGKLMVDDRITSYSTFFDHDWAADISSLARTTKLQSPVFALLSTWKSLANTHAFPWLLVKCSAGFLTGVLHGETSMSSTIIDALEHRLAKEMTALSRTRREELKSRIHAIGLDAQEHFRRVRRPLDEDAYFHSLLHETAEFPLGIWGSQRVCYGGLYHAYENLVRDSLGILLGEPEYRATFKVLLAESRRLLGDQVADSCLLSPPIDVARFVRHALAHNGGRMTKELRGKKLDLAVVDDEIHIMAPDNRALFDVLKAAASKFVEAAIAVP